jgi:cytochrome b6-f complex iron-sulfur subunit
MDRRNFLSWVSVGVFASSLPVVLAACTAQKETAENSSSASPQPATSPRSDGFAAVGTVAKLDAASFIVDAKFAGGPLVVVRDPQNKNALVAMNATCPHKGCVVDWKADKQAFICPCHAATFALDGSVKAGPAEKPLKPFTAKIEGELVLVKA